MKQSMRATTSALGTREGNEADFGLKAWRPRRYYPSD